MSFLAARYMAAFQLGYNALVVMQPLAVGAWCTLRLFTAAAMLLMIPLSLDEVVAMAWRVFSLGGDSSPPAIRDLAGT